MTFSIPIEKTAMPEAVPKHASFSKTRLSFIRWTTWEFLPIWAANLPVVAIWLWFSMRARHLFFFSTTNPGLPFGGAFGVSKFDILKMLPPVILPKTILVESRDRLETILEKKAAAGIGFPLIAKPDVGERGKGVQKIGSAPQLLAYLESHAGATILQEFCPEPEEFAVLFYRMPGAGGHFGITSVCRKTFLAVEGDGVSSIRGLLKRTVRGAFQVARFEKNEPELLGLILKKGEKKLLEPIGNHNRGTELVNAAELIDERLVATFERLTRGLDGVFYGRFDLKAADSEALKRGDFKAVELNGVFGEPMHVYHPGFGGRRAVAVFWQHWKLIFQISQINRRLGARPDPLKKAFETSLFWLKNG